jgi:hypothetical protein
MPAEIYRKWAEQLGIPKEVYESVDSVLDRVMEKYKNEISLFSTKAITLEELEHISNSMLSDVIEEFTKELGELKKGALTMILTAVNLYQFLTAVEEKMAEVVEAEENLEKIMMSCINPPPVPLFHHPLVRTVRESMMFQINMRFREIVEDIAEVTRK